MFNFFYSFRGRLLLVLAALLIATLGVQYYIYQRQNKMVAQILDAQDQAIAAGFALAFDSVTTVERLEDLQAKYPRRMFTSEAGAVVDIFVVNSTGIITDSLDPKYNPASLDDGSLKQHRITEIELPPLVDAGNATAQVKELLGDKVNPARPEAGAPRAFPVTLLTTDGTQYIIIVLGSANDALSVSPTRAASLLLPTLAVLLLAIIATTLLVWRFTQPIKNLHEAARRAAHGDFSYRVPEPVARRGDEMSALAVTFNRMNEHLGHMRELEARAVQAERSAVVGRLASAIAHEIRNPLNYINLTLDHLRTTLAPEQPEKREPFMRLADGVKTEVARINTRISEFLKYTRPSRLELRPLDLRAEIDDALRLVETQALENNIEIRVDQLGRLPKVEGDRESLRSVFTNLIINALQSIGARSGRLTITLSADARTVTTRIADTGDGISAENLEQIFEPYFSTKETGTGLGLAIVRKAIDDHGGTIEVESTPGRGTTFTVKLPAHRKDEG